MEHYAGEIERSYKLLQQHLGLETLDGWKSEAWANALYSEPFMTLFHPASEKEIEYLVTGWLQKKVLPHPCFLRSAYWLAAELYVTPETLDLILQTPSILRDELADLEYKGLLASAGNRRWWDDAIDEYSWDVTKGDIEKERMLSALRSRVPASVEIVPLPMETPVVCLGQSLTPLGFIDLKDAIRIIPDQWPSFADVAWTSREEVDKSPYLRALIHPWFADDFK